MRANSGSSSSRNPPPSDGGFTVLELMVALLLFSALGVAVWAGLVGGQNLVGRAIRLAAGTSRLLQMELYLRRTAALVQTPFWAPGPGAESAAEPGSKPGQGSLRVPWLNGDPQRTLQLSWGEGRLQVRTREEEPGAVFGPFAGVECSLYSGLHGAAGLKVTVLADADDTAPLVIQAPFGGSPFSSGGSR